LAIVYRQGLLKQEAILKWMFVVSAALGSLAGQAVVEPRQEVRELVDKLRSESIEEREKAVRKIKELGSECVPELEKAAKDGDPEVAARARDLLRVLEVMKQLTAALLKGMPGIENRLASGDDHEWTAVFLELASPEGEKPRASLSQKDLNCIVSTALQQSRTMEERAAICKAVSAHKLAAAIPDLMAMVKDDFPSHFRLVLPALRALPGPETVKELRMLLERREDRDARLGAVQLLGNLGKGEAVAVLVTLATDEDAEVRAAAALALGHLGRETKLPETARAAAVFLRDKDSNVRQTAMNTLLYIRMKEAGLEAMKLLKESSAEVRASVLWTLGFLRFEEAATEIEISLKDPDPEVRKAAIYARDQLARWKAALRGENWDELMAVLRSAENLDDASGPEGLAFSQVKAMGRAAYSHLIEYIDHFESGTSIAAVRVLNKLTARSEPLPTAATKGELKKGWEDWLKALK